jgi:hypothetical protein
MNNKKQKVIDKSEISSAHAGSALLQLRRLLPHGVIGRHINGYIFYHHKDAVMWQQSFRQYLFDTQPSPPFRLCEFRKIFLDDGVESNYNFFELSCVYGPESYVIIAKCSNCQRPFRIDMNHNNNINWMNLQISANNASSFIGDVTCGWELKIEVCSCEKIYDY